MTHNLLCVSVIISCFLILRPFSIKASPIFSDGGDKPTPFRYTFRVERVEFGDAQSDEDYDIGDYPYYDYPGCGDYIDEEYSFEDDTNEEQDEEEEDDDDDDDYEYSSDDEIEEDYNYSYSYEDQEDEYTIDYDQEEEEYPSSDEQEEEEYPSDNEEEASDSNDEEGIDTEEVTTEGYPGDDNEIDSEDDDNYDDDEEDDDIVDDDDDDDDNDDEDDDDDEDNDFDLSDYIEEYIDEYYSDEDANGQVKTVPHVRKSHSHRHPSLHGKEHPLRFNKIPFPTWKPAVRRAPLPSHSRKHLGKRPQTRHHHRRPHDVNKVMTN